MLGDQLLEAGKRVIMVWATWLIKSEGGILLLSILQLAQQVIKGAISNLKENYLPSPFQFPMSAKSVHLKKKAKKSFFTAFQTLNAKIEDYSTLSSFLEI